MCDGYLKFGTPYTAPKRVSEHANSTRLTITCRKIKTIRKYIGKCTVRRGAS
jgi:hypothetical protein